MTVDVPGVPRSERPVYRHQLQVLYAPGLLGGYWGCSHVWDDDDPADSESLHVTTDLTPEEAAESAAWSNSYSGHWSGRSGTGRARGRWPSPTSQAPP